MKTMKNRVSALVVALVMMLSLFSVGAIAWESGEGFEVYWNDEKVGTITYDEMAEAIKDTADITYSGRKTDADKNTAYTGKVFTFDKVLEKVNLTSKWEAAPDATSVLFWNDASYNAELEKSAVKETRNAYKDDGTVASSEDFPMHDQEQSIAVNLPSLSVQFYQLSARLPKRPKPEPEVEEEETTEDAAEATAEVAAEESAEATEATAEAATEEKPAPKKRTTRAKKAAEPVAEEAAEEKPAPKKRATRAKKAAEPVAEEAAEEKSAPKKRAARAKKAEGEAEAAEKPAPKKRATRAKKAEETAPEAPAETPAEEAPAAE